MRLLLLTAAGAAMVLVTASPLLGQGLARSPENSQNAAKLEQLSKKIDQQNIKIDVLSQQILKLQQQIANLRPGVMIGESAAPNGSSSTAGAETPRTQTGSSHIVARGETLTSIAKMHNVSVSELQKFNHIENDRKLQIGQTLLIPGSTPASSASPSPSGE